MLEIIKESDLLNHDFRIFKDKYLVFDTGDIFSVLTSKFVGYGTDSDGYRMLTLREKPYSHDKYTRPRVHRIVAELFIQNPNNLPQVNHIDCNKTNNAISNLEWVSERDNTIHAYQHGLYKKTLTPEDKKYIIDHYIPRHHKYGSVALSKKFGVNASHIRRVAKGDKYD